MVERYEKVKAKYDGVIATIEEKQAHFEKLGMFIKTLEQHGEPITADETEYSVGDFNVDIYASETGADRKIIVSF